MSKSAEEKVSNIQKTIEDISRKIEGLEAQKKILQISLEKAQKKLTNEG